MVDIARLPLFHRVLLSGRKAGIQEWVLLSRVDVQRIRASLSAETKLGDISWQVYDMQTTDLASLKHALPREEAMVVACKAVFDFHLLLTLQASQGTTLCVTSAMPTSADDASWGVVLHAGQIKATTPPPSAYYPTGILRCPGTLLQRAGQETWETMQRASDPWQPLVQELIACTSVKALDVSHHLWVPLTPPLATSKARAENQLLRRLGREGDSPLGRVLDRAISRTLTRRLVRTAVTPNQITLMSALIGVGGAGLLTQPSPLWQILGSLLFLLSTIIDGCDGELARLTFQETAFGAKLDLIMDNVVHLFLFPCLAVGLYRQQQQNLYLVLGALALGGVILSMVVYLPHLLRQHPLQSPQTRIHDSLASRDFAYILPFLAWFQKLHWFLWATVGGTYLFAAAWLVILWRQRRQSHCLSGEESSSV